MKKILLLIVIASLLNGCRYVDTKERYIDAKESSALIIPDGNDKPNSTSTLEVPKASSEHENGIITSVERTPPNMPIRYKQSEDGKVKIENLDGFPTLSVKTDKSNVWDSITNLEIENWTYVDRKEDACIVKLKYNDLAAREREKVGFLRKILSRDKFYSDYSGVYILACSENGNTTQTKFSKADGSLAHTFLADSIMTKLFDKFK